MKFRRTFLAALVLLLAPTIALAENPYLARQQGRSIARADIPCAHSQADNMDFIVRDCASKTNCGSDGTATAYILCDEGSISYVTTAAASAATTTTAGIVELATSGENAANVAVQGNDVRINGNVRKVRVNASATDVAGVVYNTVKEAADYVATQTRSFSAKWQIVVEGGGYYDEQPFTIPSQTDLFCSVGAYIYLPFGNFGIGSTVIGVTATSGTAITMAGNSELRNCGIQINGDTDGVRTGISCAASSGAELCNIDHVGILLDESGSSTQANVGLAATGGGNGGLSLYYVVIAYNGDNSNAVSLKMGAANLLQFSNGVVGTGGSHAKGIQALNDSPSYNWIHNVRVGSVYLGVGPTTAISIEGTGAFYASDSTYGVVSGTITDLDVAHNYRASAPPFACSAAAAGREYYDTDINKKCICNGTNYVLANDDSTTTGCS